MKKSIIVLVSILMFGACDVPGKLIIENKSGDIAIYEYETLVSGDSLRVEKIELGIQPENDEVSMYFGFGFRWTDDEIKKYLERVNCIEITSKDDTLRLENQEEMFALFQNNRHGLFDKIVKIKID